MIFFEYGLICLFGFNKSSNSEFSQQSSASNPTISEQKDTNLINIDVEGAVIKLGVYKIDSSSIIKDALVMASGLSENADRDYVSKNINLAQKLTDEAKIYILKIGEVFVANKTSSSNQSEGNLININSAT